MKVMMNQFIKRELDKCSVAKVEQISPTEFIIKRDNREFPTDIEQGHTYFIEVEDYIIHPFDGFTLHENWNNGIAPTSRNMQIEVDKIVGKMVHVKAVGEDNLNWDGWLPRKSMTIKKVIA